MIGQDLQKIRCGTTKKQILRCCHGCITASVNMQIRLYGIQSDTFHHPAHTFPL